MLITVKRDKNENIVIEDMVSGARVVLKPYQSVYVLKRLADELGYRVSIRKPMVRFKLEALSLRVWLTEGKQTRMFIVPLDVVLTYVNTLRNLRQSANTSRVSKRDLTGFVARELVGKYKDLEKFLQGGNFDWEKFFGSRTEYYVYFHVPVLLLEQLGLVKLTSRYVNMTDSVLHVNVDVIREWLSKSQSNSRPKK